MIWTSIRVQISTFVKQLILDRLLDKQTKGNISGQNDDAQFNLERPITGDTQVGVQSPWFCLNILNFLNREYLSKGSSAATYGMM